MHPITSELAPFYAHFLAVIICDFLTLQFVCQQIGVAHHYCFGDHSVFTTRRM